MIVQRYKMVVAYRGTRFHGWQQQPMLASYKGEPPPEGQGIPTVQETLARAIGEVVRHPVEVVGSSRTDAGVHAKGQIAHFDTHRIQIPQEGLRKAVNHALPVDVVVRALTPVASAFDAIRSTTSKRYQYFIWNDWDRPIFFPDLCWHRWQKLDFDAMAEAAKYLVGTHDFASFAKPGHGRENTIRTVLSCDVARRGARLVVGVEGTGFLWQMVRIMVGTLVEVGLGRIVPEDVQKMLDAKDRQAAGPTAPPEGLFLQWIKTTDDGEAVVRPELAEATAPGERVVIRPLRGNYYEGAIDVIRSLRQWFDDKGVETFAREIRFHNGYVAMISHRVVGVVAFNVMEHAAQIQWMGIRAEQHRKGIGKMLVARVIEDLNKAGVKEVFVHTLGDSVEYEPYARTRAFWSAMGFAEHHRVSQDYPGWTERLVMRRVIGDV